VPPNPSTTSLKPIKTIAEAPPIQNNQDPLAPTPIKSGPQHHRATWSHPPN